jgi:hypothetical protein
MPDTAPAQAHRLAPARTAAAADATYTVRGGDSLSAISGRLFGSASVWPRFYAANKGVIGVNPNFIKPGQLLRRLLSTPAQAQAALPAPPPPAPAPVQAASDQQAPASSGGQQPAPQQPAPTITLTGGSWPGGAFGNCVVQRESGGNPNVMNASGHYGLYQFSASTWAAYGGNPGSFGNASVAEQEQVFMNALARGGQSNWSPYDGC